MSSPKICTYCGEYEHDCQCLAARKIKKLERELAAAINLTKPEINHLLGLIEYNEHSGEYTAPLEQYWLRSDRIKSKLRESA